MLATHAAEAAHWASDVARSCPVQSSPGVRPRFHHATTALSRLARPARCSHCGLVKSGSWAVRGDMHRLGSRVGDGRRGGRIRTHIRTVLETGTLGQLSYAPWGYAVVVDAEDRPFRLPGGRSWIRSCSSYPGATASVPRASSGSVMHGLTDPWRCAADLYTVFSVSWLLWLSRVVPQMQTARRVSRGRLLVRSWWPYPDAASAPMVSSGSAANGQLRPSCCLTDLNTMSSMLRFRLHWLQPVFGCDPESCGVRPGFRPCRLHPL